MSGRVVRGLGWGVGVGGREGTPPGEKDSVTLIGLSVLVDLNPRNRVVVTREESKVSFSFV